MSDIHADALQVPAATGGNGSVADYFALLKPRVMSLVVFTAAAGLVAAPGHIHPWIAAVAILAIAIGGGAAGALNMWYDADIDRVMKRTADRPVPRGDILPSEALSFGLILAVGSVALLGLATNWFAAGLLAFTIFFYVAIYTMWLKRWTAQNIVIGGASGAFPPMIGWAAATGSLELAPIVFFLVIFLWTPPHFWALALARNEDYVRAEVPMMPAVAGASETRRQIVLYSVLLVLSSLVPCFIGAGGPLYAAGALILGGKFIADALTVYRRREGKEAVTACWRLFGYSILYLFAIFGLVMAEQILSLPPFPSVLA